MSLQKSLPNEVPEQTRQIAKAAFPKGSPAMHLRDEFGTLYQDTDFADLFSRRGQPALPAWRLALVTVLQFQANLSDRQAADAVRGRIDWKYALGLELNDPGFHFSVLSDFRSRLICGDAEYRMLDIMLEHFRLKGLVKARGKQRTDSTHVLGAVRDLHLAELVGETLRSTLNELADVAPEWLQGLVQPEWFKRYGHRVEDSFLPRKEEKRRPYVLQIGLDGFVVLDALEAQSTPEEVKRTQRIKILKQVWDTHFDRTQEGIRWKDSKEFPRVAERIQSPYDPEMHYSTKRSTEWSGYKVHVTESCDAEEMHVITHVHTTPSMEYDGCSPQTIHEKLAQKKLLPSEHFVDSAYMDAELLVTSQREHAINLMGPIRQVSTWQGRGGLGYDSPSFKIDWENQQATCPQGKISVAWRNGKDQVGHPRVTIYFSRTDCGSCPVHHLCTRSKPIRRVLQILEQDEYEALNQARGRMLSEEFKQSYQIRTGIEGTLSQGVRCVGLRQSRYVGLKKTRLHHVCSAAAINIARLAAWLEGRPRAKTRISSFSRLAPAI